jgi:hypothetical protein
MGKNNNINSPLIMHGTDLNVTGVSTGVDGGTLISRNVAITQGDTTIHGPANLDPDWTTDPALAAAGFTAADPALVIATETHVIENRPFFVTETWARIVKIQSVP